jgi:hypothetical protein
MGYAFLHLIIPKMTLILNMYGVINLSEPSKWRFITHKGERREICLNNLAKIHFAFTGRTKLLNTFIRMKEHIVHICT